MGDEHASRVSTRVVTLPDLPGEDLLAHQGIAWEQSAITKLAPHELVAVAETGVPPSIAEIIDTPLDDYPLLAADDSYYERRNAERSKIRKEHRANVERRKRAVFQAWTLLFDSLRSACERNAPMLAMELFELCDLRKRGIPGGYFDGPRAWAIIMDRIHGNGVERTKFDKNFYSTALELQRKNPLSDGCLAADYQKRAHAFITHIMPHLAQKFEPLDAAEYVIGLMPPGLYEAGQRVKFTARGEGKCLDLQYLARLCRQEVFEKHLVLHCQIYRCLCVGE